MFDQSCDFYLAIKTQSALSEPCSAWAATAFTFLTQETIHVCSAFYAKCQKANTGMLIE